MTNLTIDCLTPHLNAIRHHSLSTITPHTKLHLRCDGNGLPIKMLLTVGERHEAVVFETLMEQGAVKRLDELTLISHTIGE